MTKREVNKILSKDQQELAKSLWNQGGKDKKDDLTLLNIAKTVAPNCEDLDRRSEEFKAVRHLLTVLKLKTSGGRDYEKIEINLTEDQKEYIKTNSLESNLELAQNIFRSKTIAVSSKKYIAVKKYKEYLLKGAVEEASSSGVSAENEESSENQQAYSPPDSIAQLATRVNFYISNTYSKQRTNRQQKNLDSLFAYLKTYRFIHQINTYTSDVDRKLFESSFIRYTFDKADLTQEEVDQYIVLCTEVVISANIQRTIQTMQEQIAVELDSGEKIPMTLVEAVNSARTEYNQCVGRQQKLLNDLKVKRSERISKQVKENASILNLVQLWKDEESRKEMIKMADMRREVLKTEINKLSSMDDVKARIFGLTEQEVLDG
jgi:hypothetical protein